MQKRGLVRPESLKSLYGGHRSREPFEYFWKMNPSVAAINILATRKAPHGGNTAWTDQSMAVAIEPTPRNSAPICQRFPARKPAILNTTRSQTTEHSKASST